MATYTGGSGNDSQTGSSSADTIYGGAGNDTANAGTGNDLVYSGDGNDFAYGGNGDDSLSGEAGNDYLDGGAGKDNLTGGQGFDTIYGGGGDDSIMGDGQFYGLTASSGNSATNLTLNNYADGPVEIWWVNSSGTLQYFATLDAGQSVVQPTYVGHNWMLKDTQGYYLEKITAGSNSTVNYGQHTADSLFGGDGNDSIFAQFGNDTVFGGAGHDLVDLGSGDDSFGTWSDESGNDTISGGTGNDTIIAGAGDDLVYGGDGDDLLSGAVGNDSVYGGLGNDRFSISDDHEADYMEGGADWDIVYYSNYISTSGVNVTFTGTDAGSYNYAGTSGSGSFIQMEGIGGTDYNDTINAAADTNGVFIQGNGGDDSLTGGSGADEIEAGTGNDTVIGNAGKDAIYAGLGNDVLYGGADEDSFFINANEGSDQIFGGSGGVDQDTLALNGAASTPVTLTFSGSESGSFGYSGGGAGSFQDIERFTLTAGNDTVNGASNSSAMRVIANEGDDLVTTGSGDNYIDGGVGNDKIYAGAGNDTLIGGAGNDTLAGGAGADALFGGTGMDIADYSASTAAVSINLQTGTASGGDAQGDTLSGVDGISGSAFNDTLIGADAQSTLPGDTFSSYIDGGAGNDSIDGRAGADTLMGGDGDDTVIGGSGADSVFGGLGNDLLTGGTEEDVVFGGLGDDLIYGGDGADYLQGDDGNDLLNGGSGADVLIGGAGIDTADYSTSNAGVTVNLATGTGMGGEAQGDVLSGIENITGSGFNDVLMAQNTGGQLSGALGDDSLSGGAGNDLLFGGAGEDTAGFAGNVTDYSFARDPSGALAVTDSVGGRSGVDTIDGFEYVTFNGVTYHLVTGDDGANLTLQGTGDGTPSLIIAHDGNDWGGGHATSDVIYAGAGDDTLNGGDGNDTLLGEAGNDLLYGEGNNDAVYGGSGQDTLDGGAGDDTLEGGEGADSLRGDTGNDLMRGDAGADTIFGQRGDDTAYGGSGDDSLYGGDGNDTLSGDAGRDRLFGDDGNDLLDGGAENDTLTGGAGADTLTGGLGADDYALTQDGGADIVTDFDMTFADGKTWDQLDVSDLTNAKGDPIRWHDVTVSDTVGDGSGDTILTFPNGESVTLQGVRPDQIDNKQEMSAIGIPCFTSGTQVQTPQGWVTVETLRAGDLVLTQTGPQRVLWSGQRALDAADLARNPEWKPVHFPVGAIGNTTALRLSGQHAVLMTDAQGAPVFVRAKHLAEIGYGKSRVAQGVRQVRYHHILLASHAVICANGAATESFYPGASALAMLDWPARLALCSVIAAHAKPQLRGAAAPPAQLYGERAHPLATRKMLAGLTTAVFAPAKRNRINA